MSEEMNKNLQNGFLKDKAGKDRRKKFFLTGFFLLITLLSLTALNIKYGNGSFSFRGKKTGRLTAFDPAKVRKISISWKENRVTLVMGKDQLWRIMERKMALASAARIGDLLHHLSTLQILKELDDPTEDMLRSLNLITGEDKKHRTAPGITVVLQDDSGKKLFEILLGSGHYPPASRDVPGTVTAKGRYVLNNGRVFLVSRLFENCIPLPQIYVEPLAIKNMTKALLIMRTALEEKKGKDGKITKGNVLTPAWAAVRQRTSTPLRMTFPPNTLPDARKLSAYSETLAKQLTTDILPDIKSSEVSLSSMVTVRLADGFSYRLGIGEKGKENLLVPHVEFDAKVLQKLPGESTKRYQARIAGAKLRYESEKRYYNGKVFLMVPSVAEKLAQSPFRQRRREKLPPAIKKQKQKAK